MNDTKNDRPANRLSIRERLAFAHARAQGLHLETDLSRYLRELETIKSFDFSESSDRDLLDRTSRLRTELSAAAERENGNETGLALRAEVFAIVREACRRELSQDPFDVQITAGIVLSQGKLAQMKTGEGKTLALVFAAAFSALGGRKVHVFTANEYLARRDAAWMGGVYRRLGLRASFVREEMIRDERRDAYAADVTYLTAKQCGFDYLSNGLCYSKDEYIDIRFETVIIDEADFILIDEARIPLVIASRDSDYGIDHAAVDSLSRTLVEGVEFTRDRHGLGCTLTLEGQHRVERELGCGGMHEESAWNVYAAVHSSLYAHTILSRDVDYIVRDDKIEQVDGLTGRVADRRKWPYGVQAALEAKEGLSVQPEGRILGSMTVQDLVGLYTFKAAATATAVSAASELYRAYGLAVVVIPPNRPDITVHAPDRVFTTKESKRGAILEEITEVHRTGRPILVGTASVEESETISRLLTGRGIVHNVLNAKNDEKEAALVACAGMLSAVTISTNMAGRGTDIRLGGDAGEGRDRIRELGGLYVLGTNRMESVRVDNQLRGRSGRQGDPGTTRLFVSLEDDLVKKFAIREFIPERYLGSDDGREIPDPRVAKEIGRAQWIIENEHAAMRKTLRNYTALIDRERTVVRSLRDRALLDDSFPESLADRCEGRIRELEPAFGKEPLLDLLRRVFFSTLDEFWADHLASVEEIRDTIRYRRWALQEPLYAFIRQVDKAFLEGLGNATEKAADRFLELLPENETGRLPDADRGLPGGPASTWTYLLNDEVLPAFSISIASGTSTGDAVLGGMRAMALAPLAVLRFLTGRAAAAAGKLRTRIRSRR